MKNLQPGELVTCKDRATSDAGTTRMRVADGWISLKPAIVRPILEPLFQTARVACRGTRVR